MVKLINESNLPDLDTTNLTQKGIETFSKVYRLDKDLWFGNINEYYTQELIEYSPFADMILKDGFWTRENGDVYIPAGTEVAMRPMKGHPRLIDLYILNVPEFGDNAVIYGWDDTYAAGDWIEEIVNNSTPIN